jgi:glutathione S-transferase
LSRADRNKGALIGERFCKYCYVFFFENAFKPVMKAPTDAGLVEKETPRWRHLASVLDGRLAKSKWVVGNGFTIADVAIAAPMHLHEKQRPTVAKISTPQPFG